jgi:hypothetical protein
MQGKFRTITNLPLAELWDERMQTIADRQRYLSQEDVRQLVRAGSVRFSVANIGDPLRWIPIAESHAFWKLEVRPHLVDDPNRPFDIYAFPEGYCYIASEWRGPGEEHAVVLLERHH